MSARVDIIFTGGTIDSLGRDRLDLAWYIEAGQRLDASGMLARLPELAAITEVAVVPFRRLPSHALVDRDWLELHALVENRLADPACAGVVITHGTNTLEETAYFLHLTVHSDKPVVLTGAMRPASALSADGDLNLLNAVRVAASPQAARRGCLVVMNDTIFGARDVTKTATYRVEAFRSRDLGPLGFADADGAVTFYHRSDKPHTTASPFAIIGRRELPRVDVVVSYVGADGALIAAAVAAGAKGIVSAATGAGRPTPAEDAAFDAARRDHGTLMCLCSRVAGGRSVRSPGLKARGFIAGDNLPPWKARILLSLGLLRTRDPDELQQLFDTY